MSADIGDDEQVRFTVQMPKRLRKDAKRKAERGELSEEIRDLFRRMAYGISDTSGNTEIDKLNAELRDVRARIDDLRKRRRQVDVEIEAQEDRAARLEERVSNLEERADSFETTVNTLEKMLLDGTRIFPERIDDDLNATRVIEALKERNPDVPPCAYDVAEPYEPNDWREATDD